MSAAQQKHSHDSGFWKTFLRAVAANLEHALILFTWDASCKACCSMWIFLCVSPAKNVHSAAAGGLEWIWERVQKMVGGCVAWVKGSGWKSLSDEGIQRKDDASACPGQSQDGGREGGNICFHRVPQDADPDLWCCGGGVFAALTVLAAARQEMAGAAWTFHHIPSRVLSRLPGSLWSLMAGLGIASHFFPSSSL